MYRNNTDCRVLKKLSLILLGNSEGFVIFLNLRLFTQVVSMTLGCKWMSKGEQLMAYLAFLNRSGILSNLHHAHQIDGWPLVAAEHFCAWKGMLKFWFRLYGGLLYKYVKHVMAATSITNQSIRYTCKLFQLSRKKAGCQKSRTLGPTTLFLLSLK